MKFKAHIDTVILNDLPLIIIWVEGSFGTEVDVIPLLQLAIAFPRTVGFQLPCTMRLDRLILAGKVWAEFGWIWRA